MAVPGGPNIITNGLVTYFDVANVDSFRGEPTTNQYLNPDFENNTTSWRFGTFDGTRYAYTVETVIGPFGLPVKALKITRTSSNTSSAHFHQGNSGKYSNGNTYTLSAYVKGSGTLRKLTQTGFVGNTGNETLTSEWKRIEYTVLSSTDTAYPYWAAELITQNVPMYFTLAQSEQKPYSTPFVNGTRGTTVATGGGVFDISNNNNNAEFLASTFNSSYLGSIVFDGTDDYLKVSNPNTGPLTMVDTGDCTISFWASNIGSSAYRWLISNWSTTGVHLGMTSTLSRFGGYFGDNSEIRSDYSIPIDGSWHFYTVIRNLGTIKFYVDGMERSISVGTPTSKNGTFSAGVETRIGTRGNENSQRWIGNISICQIYNRALTADEILQNYNSTKSRFGIT